MQASMWGPHSLLDATHNLCSAKGMCAARARNKNAAQRATACDHGIAQHMMNLLRPTATDARAHARFCNARRR
eukprot:2158619-Alexandrium_andersonii.AAC.1